MPEADCFKCVWFVPREGYTLEELWELAKSGSGEPLGYCRKWRKTITYRFGWCRHYRPREQRPPPPGQETLDKWVPREGF